MASTDLKGQKPGHAGDREAVPGRVPADRMAAYEAS